MPDNGIALERREAPGPTSLGQRARKRQPLVTGDLPWRAADPGFGFANRRRSAGGASRRSIASCESEEKGTGGPARAPEFKAPGIANALEKCAVLEAAPPSACKRRAPDDNCRRRNVDGRQDKPLPRRLCAMAARSAGFLGRGRGRDRLDREADDRVRPQRRGLWPLVHRRRLQHLLQRGGPPRRGRPRRAGGDRLRLAGHQHQADHHLRRAADQDRNSRRHPQAQFRRRERRPRHPLHADGAGGAGGDAGLRADRRDSFGGVRRLRAEGACHPDRRLHPQGHDLGKLRHRGRAGHSLQAAARRGDQAVEAQAVGLPDPATAAGEGRTDARAAITTGRRPGTTRWSGRTTCSSRCR